MEGTAGGLQGCIHGPGLGQRRAGRHPRDGAETRVPPGRRESRLPRDEASGAPPGGGEGRGVQVQARQEGSFGSIGTSKVPASISARRASMAGIASAGTSSGT